MKIKENIPLILALYYLSGIIINILLCFSGYSYVPNSTIAFTVVESLAVLSLSMFCIINKKYTSRISSFVSLALPVLALVFGFENPAFAKDNAVFFCVMLTVFYLVGIVVIIVCNKGDLAVIFGCLYGIMLIGVVGLLSLICLFANFGKTTVVHQIESPNGIKIAQIVDVDVGATGGATHIKVREIKKRLLLGNLEREEIIYTTDYGRYDNLNVYWKNQNIIVIDGSEYNVG